MREEEDRRGKEGICPQKDINSDENWKCFHRTGRESINVPGFDFTPIAAMSTRCVPGTPPKKTHTRVSPSPELLCDARTLCGFGSGRDGLTPFGLEEEEGREMRKLSLSLERSGYNEAATAWGGAAVSMCPTNSCSHLSRDVAAEFSANIAKKG